jgi:D-sedoheptulose 7-phosphate isomerase
VVVAISASGNSPNIIKAIEFANSKGATTVGLTGFDGGKLMKLAKLNVHVPSEKGEYGPVEDVHMVFDHVAHAFITSLLRADGEIA